MPIYDDIVSDYITRHFAYEDRAIRRAREDSPKKGLPDISIQPEEGRFLQFLTATSQAKVALEIGTLGGYSGIWIARGLVNGGKLYTLEMSERHAEVAREHFVGAGVEDRVEIVIGNAHDSLSKLVPHHPFDFVFIDAEKSGYLTYYEWAVAHLRTGGIVAAHNAFRGGHILTPHDEEIKTFTKFLHHVAGDVRVVSTIYPAGDGTLVATKIA